MILGDPYNFAIFTKTIKEWNLDKAFCNGVLLFCVDGDLFPKKIVTATLKCEIFSLKEKLENIAVDEVLYSLPTDRAFGKIYNLTFPEDTDIDNDYRFDISPESFSGENCYIFAVSNGEQVRIMAAELNYNIKESRHELKEITIRETFLATSELNEMISKLDIY